MVKKQPVSSEAGALKESQTKEEEKTPRAGLTIPRYFTQPGVSPYDAVTWELRDATIGNDKGELVFEQKGVEVPASWSQLATNIAASKYFHGHMGTSKRERSIRQLVGRVVDTIKEWGIKGNYFKTAADADIFADELAHLLLTQKAAFNSPVWFNVGIEPHPQGSACFINSVSDTMPSILDLAKTEGMLFKYGSGTGTNFSSIRSSKERLSTGGIASGPVSFMRGFDAFAGVIKSGGRTRRAAKMVILNIDHPDVEEFITCKAREEQKAWTLIDAGYDGSLTGDAYSSIFFQNANHSVRVSDAFMQAAENDGEWYTRAVTTGQPMDHYKARDLLRMIAESAHVCGDPGMQYDDTINRWHTCKNTARINASNPCCVTGDTLIAVADGRNAVPIKDLVGTEVPVYAHDHTTGRTTISRMWNIGIKREHAAVYRVTLDDGSSFRATDDHLIMLRDGAYRMVRDLQPDDSLMPFHSKVLAPAETRTKRRYYWTGHSWQPEARALGVEHVPSAAIVAQHFSDNTALLEQAALYNHKVVSVEFCGYEDVYDGTVDTHHNFAILTSAEPSCASGAQNYSGLFIHNSEYMFLDDTACNLASLNLMKFARADGGFDVAAFRAACATVITAQEIIVDNASYPTPRIAENSHNYRPLGLGYANLGALLMFNGIPYDSDKGRDFAAAITAMMTGQAYLRSAEIARELGPFPGYEKNREPMLGVIAMHRSAVKAIDPDHVPSDLYQAAWEVWDQALELGKQYGYKNAQASVLAPTGCLVGGSLIATDYGLIPLDTIGNPNGKQWQDISLFVHTDEGPQAATKFYINGVAMTRRLKTACGYEIQGTPEHRIKVLDPETGQMNWRRFAEIKEGDIIPLALNTMIGTPHTVTLPPLEEMHWTGDYTTRVPREVTPELAELVGYFMGDGSLHSKGLRFCVSQPDTDVVEHLSALLRDLFNLTAQVESREGYWEVAVNSVPLVLWWEACGFAKHKPHENHSGKGYAPHIPNAILYTNNPDVYTAFLRGLYEADGTVTAGVPCWSTAQATFSQQVKTLLLALGYPTTTKIDQSGWGQSDLFVLRLRNNSFNIPFRREIGFIGQRKHQAIKLPAESQSGKHDYIPLTAERFEELVPVGSPYRDAAALSYRRGGGITRGMARKVYDDRRNEHLEQAMNFFYDHIVANEDGGEQLTYDLSVPSNVTYTAGGFISHNTIGLLMDCDTTGVEPDLALVKYKKLVGGGLMRIVNNTVPVALQRLGYTPEQTDEIVAYIDQNGTIEGAPHVQPKDLPVFDCAFKAPNGARAIHYMGHVKMMASVQPFLSGAISKTVNMPNESTVEEIMQTYVAGWKLGLKAIAIYRDGSKRTQPLNSAGARAKKGEAEAAVKAAPETVPEKVVYKPVRHKLPSERRSITHKFSVGGHEGYITVGMFDDGTPGEIFLVMAKEGSTISGLMDAFATAISMALQYGVPIKALIDKFSHMRFEPSGFTGNPEIPMAKSIMDYVFRWLALKFLPPEERARVGLVTPEGLSVPPSPSAAPAAPDEAPTDNPALYQTDAPSCSDCGAIMVRNGTCYKCVNCGETSGCS